LYRGPKVLIKQVAKILKLGREKRAHIQIENLVLETYPSSGAGRALNKRDLAGSDEREASLLSSYLYLSYSPTRTPSFLSALFRKSLY